MIAEFAYEANEHYKKAILGDTYQGKRRRRAIKRSLPVLSSFVNLSNIVSTVELGTREIRLDRVIGTYYEGRSNMFASDFIPLADVNSEFAHKWIELCASQLEVGIREPILVYEYLNYYYVQEGNKRVSVLKYFDAATISAQVVRLIPSYEDNNWDIELYYAFLEFYKQTNYEDIWFRKPSCFTSMVEFMDLTEDKESYKDYLRTYYLRFRRSYKQLENSLDDAGGLTTGDVFLGYCRMFGLELLDEDSMKPRLQEVIHHINADTVVEIDDDLRDASNLLPSFRKLRVAFAFPYDSKLNGWSRDHYKSMKLMQKTYSNQVSIDLIEGVMTGKGALKRMKKAISSGYDFVFLIDEALMGVGERLAIENPKTTFLICSGSRSSYLVPNYFGKIYQANFLLGMYAALACHLDRIGYVSCDMNEQIFKAMRAFEAGYKSIRPTGVITYASSAETLPDRIKISAYYRSIEKSHLTEGTVNTFLKKKGEKDYMAYTYWQWEKFYTQIFTHLINGSLKRLRSNQKDAGNLLFFHWGIGTEVIGVHINEAMTSPLSELVLTNMTKDIAAGRIEVEEFCDTSDYESWFEIYR